MRLIRAEDSVGHVLCHDITQTVKGVAKNVVFCKGHIVMEEDIPALLSVGNEYLYVWEKQEGMLHENEAAEILRQICEGKNLHSSEVKEGKFEMIADCDGILKIHGRKLQNINALDGMMIASRHGNFPVKKGDTVAETQVIPLVIRGEQMDRAREAAGKEPVFQVKPYQKKRAGIVATGSEVYSHRIQDTFSPVVEKKLAEFGVKVCEYFICNDNTEMIFAAIHEELRRGCNLILCTGGMNMDPNDKTPLAIRNVAGSVVSYGVPVLPGAMFLLAYYGGDFPIMGLPSCVMYAKRTIFDLVLPRVLAGEVLTAEDLNRLGEGGLCLNCPVCAFPNCGFGKCTSQ